MKTYVIEGVLRNYLTGMIVVKAENETEAIELIFSNPDLYLEGERTTVINNIRELKDNEIVYVYGG